VAADDILQELAGFPDPETIGRSSQGRPILAGRFGANHRPASLLVVAGVHGDEPATVEATADLARRLTLGELSPPAPFWLIPALNPDGLAVGQKNSARDVDLNRNFPALNFTTTHQPGYFPGATPLSEPETQALVALIDREAITRVVAVHAPFACVNYDGPAQNWARDVAAACGWPVRADLGYPTPGSFGTWFGVDQGRPILTLELPPGPFAPFAAACRRALAAAVSFALPAILLALGIGETL
jgi:protein MpaA